MELENLTLYHYNECPYCRRVTSFLEQNSIAIPLKNTLHDQGAREELISIGGRSQVPCLVIDGDPLYESSDIIDWFKQNVLKR